MYQLLTQILQYSDVILETYTDVKKQQIFLSFAFGQ